MYESATRTQRLVHRHAHDVRNQLNNLELDVMLTEELTGDPATLDCLARLRKHLAVLELHVKSLLVKFAEPEPIVVRAEDLLQLWRRQIAPLQGAGREIEWVFASRPASLRVDARAVVAALTELTRAAWSRAGGRALTAVLAVTDVTASVALREPGQGVALAPDLISELDRLVTANNGSFEHEPAGDATGWVTTLTFPVLPGE